MKLNLQPLIDKPRLFRARIGRGVKAGVDRGGGDYGAGLIRGAAIITRGEALGHYMWVDDVMVRQAADAVNAATAGVKSRFAHPGLSGDGLGKALGRFRDATVDGEIARGDLHLYESAHETPDGDLAKYVMDMAVEDPEAFGTSIAFEPDIGAEDKFMAEHEDKDGRFKSPDGDNKGDYPHARIAELGAVDMVDDPAANPEGLFHRGDEVSYAADALVAYALGLEDECPASAFGIHPDRVRGFVQRYLASRGLDIVSDFEIEVDDAVEHAWRAAARGRLIQIEQEGK